MGRSNLFVWILQTRGLVYGGADLTSLWTRVFTVVSLPERPRAVVRARDGALIRDGSTQSSDGPKTSPCPA